MSDVKNSVKLESDELVRFLEEYKQKLNDIVQQEQIRQKDMAEQESIRIIDGASEKAERIVREAEEKALKDANSITDKAKSEALVIISEARSNSQKIVTEAEEKVKKEAKEKTRREADNILKDAKQNAEREYAETIDRSKKEAEDILKNVRAQAESESSDIIDAARSIAKKLNDDAITSFKQTDSLLNELIQKSQILIETYQKELVTELETISGTIQVARNELEGKIAKEHDTYVEEPRASVPIIDQIFSGRNRLAIEAVNDYAQIKKLKEGLKHLPNLRITGESGYEGNFSISIEALEPISLSSILQEVPIINRCSIQDGVIKLSLI